MNTNEKLREALAKADKALANISKSAWFLDANFAETKEVMEAGNAIDMDKEERKIAELLVMRLHKAIDALALASKNADDLVMIHGWDIATDDITKAAMLIGKEALGVVESIAQEDEWQHYKSKEVEG